MPKSRIVSNATRSTKPRFTREAPEQRRANLIQATIRCLGRGGIAAFRVEQICAEAKVSLGLLNHYFPSKDDLLVAVYRTVFYDIRDETKPRRRAEKSDYTLQKNPAARLRRILNGIMDPAYLQPANLTVWLALWGEIVVNPSLKRTHKTLYRNSIRELAERIEAVAVERGCEVDSVELARNLIALIDGLFLERALDRNAVSYAGLRRAAYELLALHLGDLTPD